MRCERSGAPLSLRASRATIRCARPRAPACPTARTRAQLTARRALPAGLSSCALAVCPVPCTMYPDCPHVRSLCALYHVPCTLYPVPCTLYRVPCTLIVPMCARCVPCTLYNVPCTLYHTPCLSSCELAMCPVPCTLYPVSCTLLVLMCAGGPCVLYYVPWTLSTYLYPVPWTLSTYCVVERGDHVPCALYHVP